MGDSENDKASGSGLSAAPALVDLKGEEAEDPQQAELDANLDAEADAMLADLAYSQAEVQRMIEAQRNQTEELGGLRDSLAAELQELQDEAWKLQVYGELESLKQQLATLNSLEADLDRAEAVLDASEGDEAKVSGSSDVKEEEEEEEGDDDDAEYDPEEVAVLQEKLDKELAEMFEQLQAVRAEAATVSARKESLEAELKQMMEMAKEDELKALSVANNILVDMQLTEIAEGSDSAGEGAAAAATSESTPP